MLLAPDADGEDSEATEAEEEPEPDEEAEPDEEPEAAEEPEADREPEPEDEPALALDVLAVVDEVADVMLLALVAVVVDPGSGVNGSRATPARWTVAPLVVSATGWAELVRDWPTASPRV